ncbi:hypothetical protein [Hyphomicrobium sp. MC1]|uniref:hypothetical protein n=1 Tax=Hyphomicrobium sp. (strain MC1) TaxID=717785 RepID=UPI00059CFDC7|nr:hypothetical protein [Hyphomicrobium sp. MC1]
MAVLAQSYNMQNSMINDQLQDMQNRNDWLTTANNALAALREARPSDANSTQTYPDFKTADGTEMNVKDWMDSQGISIENNGEDYKGIQQDFDSAINNLKSGIDSANSTSQLEMIRLQGLMDKRGQTADQMSNNVKKKGEVADNVIGNMR